MGDFNCSEVNWEMFESGGENTWGNRLSRLTMNNAMIQWVTDYTRYREDELSRLDLLFTKRINLKKDITYECTIGKNDYVVLEIEIRRDMEEEKVVERKV